MPETDTLDEVVQTLAQLIPVVAELKKSQSTTETPEPKPEGVNMENEALAAVLAGQEKMTQALAAMAAQIGKLAGAEAAEAKTESADCGAPVVAPKPESTPAIMAEGPPTNVPDGPKAAKPEDDGSAEKIASLEAQVAALKAAQDSAVADIGSLKTEPADEDRKALAEAQEQAEDTMNAVGESAVPALRGETVTDYKARLLSKALAHPHLKGAAGEVIKPEAYIAISKADSATANSVLNAAWTKLKDFARKPASVAVGKIHVIPEKIMGSGVRLTSVASNPNAFYTQFQYPVSKI